MKRRGKRFKMDRRGPGYKYVTLDPAVTPGLGKGYEPRTLLFGRFTIPCETLETMSEEKIRALEEQYGCPVIRPKGCSETGK